MNNIELWLAQKFGICCHTFNDFPSDYVRASFSPYFSFYLKGNSFSLTLDSASK